MKLIIILFFFNMVNAQDQFNRKETEDNLENLLQSGENEIVINRVNYLLKKAKSEQTEINLKIYKLEALATLELYDEALLLAKEILNFQELRIEQQYKIYVIKSLIYECLEEFTRSTKNLNNAHQILKRSPTLHHKYYTYFLVRSASLKRVQGRKDYINIVDSAIYYGKKTNSDYHLSLAYLVKSFYYDSMDDKSLLFLGNALDISKGIKHKPLSVTIFNNISRRYLDRKDIIKAIKYTDSSLIYLKNSHNNNYKSWTYKLRSQIFEKNDSNDSALINYKRYKLYDDKYNFNLKKLGVRELDAKINSQNALHNLEIIKNHNKILVISIISSFIVLVVLMAATIIFYNKKKIISSQNQTIKKDFKVMKELVKEKSILMQELNHRVKNNLSIILSMIQFQKNGSDKDALNQKLEDLHNRVYNLAVSHDYLFNNTQIDGSIELNDYLNRIINSIFKSLSTMDRLDFKLRCPEIYVSKDRSLLIGLLTNELVTNSIKHAEINNRLIIDIKISTDVDKILYIFRDNGKALSWKNKKETFGITIIEAMIQQLQGEYTRYGSEYFIKIKKNEV